MADDYLWHDEFIAESHKVGLVAALNIQFENTMCITAEIPSCFGKKWARYFNRIRAALLERYQDEVENLFFLAEREYAYACHKAASYVALSRKRGFEILNQDCPDSELATPAGYAEHEGWAYTLYNSLSELNPHTSLLPGIKLSEFPSSVEILNAMSIVWIFNAAKLYTEHSEDAMNVLFEASDATTLAEGIMMWDESEKCYKEENISSSRRDFALQGAIARHYRDPKQKEKLLVRECWQEWQRDPDRYKGKAAFARDMLEKCEYLTSQKKIEDWCREWEGEKS